MLFIQFMYPFSKANPLTFINGVLTTTKNNKGKISIKLSFKLIARAPSGEGSATLITLTWPHKDLAYSRVESKKATRIAENKRQT